MATLQPGDPPVVHFARLNLRRDRFGEQAQGAHPVNLWRQGSNVNVMPARPKLKSHAKDRIKVPARGRGVNENRDH